MTALARSRFALLWLSLGLALGCDKAKPDMQACERLEQQGKRAEAIQACAAAVSKDPKSASGQRAAALLHQLQQAAMAAELQAHRAREAREQELMKQLNVTPMEGERERIKAELARFAAQQAAKRQGAASADKPPCICAPQDPLCACP